MAMYFDDDEDDGFDEGQSTVQVVAAEVDHTDEQLRLSDLAKLARRTRRRMVRGSGRRQADLRLAHSEHLGVPLEGVEVVEESWPSYDLVNVQVGLNAWLDEAGPGRSGNLRTHRLVGLARYRHRVFGLSDLLQRSYDDDEEDYGPTPGNVSWSNLASGPDGQVQRAVRAGLYLVTEGPLRSAILVLASDPESGMGAAQVHVVANQPGAAGAIAAELRRLALVHNVFRGQVISFGRDMFGERGAALQFHRRPSLTEDEVILPAETLATIRRQVVGVAEHRERLLDARPAPQAGPAAVRAARGGEDALGALPDEPARAA